MKTGYKMAQLTRILVRRLVAKGMQASTLPAYVRDLANTIVAHGNSSLRELNGRLQSLGWDEFELDEYTLQLILATFEPDPAYKPPHWFDRTFDPQGLAEVSEERECAQALQINHNKPVPE